jgi:hypothetical protein
VHAPLQWRGIDSNHLFDAIEGGQKNFMPKMELMLKKGQPIMKMDLNCLWQIRKLRFWTPNSNAI